MKVKTVIDVSFIGTSEKDAFKKGFKQAEETWGGELPEISQKTYDAVLEKFDAWANESTEITQ